MRVIAGVDVGQSSTTAAIGDRDGKEIARSNAGPGDEVGQDARSTRLRDAVDAALAGALREANLPADTTFSAVVAGISGYEGRFYGAPPEPRCERFVAVHDTAIAHAGAFGGGPGVLAIAGTGSAILAGDGGDGGLLLGGWGYLFGDEGSAFALARGAIVEATMQIDRGAEPSRLTRVLLDGFACDSVRALVRAFYAGEIDRARLAAFAVDVIRLAAEGIDAGAVALVEQSAIALAVTAASAARRANLLPAPFAVTGGLGTAQWFLERIDAAITDLDLPLERQAPERDPAAGALLLARRLTERQP